MNSIEKAVEGLFKSKPAVESPSPSTPVAAGTAGRRPLRQNRSFHIDLSNLSRLGYVTPDNASSKTSEELRLIKRPILRNAFGKDAVAADMANLIMVTSSVPSEGKTFTALNLAMSIVVERDTTVLLVDGDVVNPSLSRLFGLQGEPGFTDLLANPEMDVADVILDSDIPHLRFLPAGKPHAYSTELVASDRMRELASELSKRYPDRIVMFDSPPLLAATQASALSHHVGQVVMVVEAGKTSQTTLQEAVELLDQTKTIGMVLNKSRRYVGRDRYGAYYGSAEK
jgi:exopolysaccharide/PEP-CTERM locus tyrosine autokinase